MHRREVNLSLIAAALDDEPGKADSGNDSLYVESGFTESLFSDRDEPVDSGAAEAEEVEISRLPIDQTENDEGRSTGEGEVLSLLEAPDYLGDLVLERAQHARSTDRCRLNQLAHARANGRWQHEITPQSLQLVDVDEVSDILLGPLTKDLFVNAQAISSIAEVVVE